MNLRDLKYLVAVADLRSFHKAAIHCHASQPALSNQIRKLEETLGVSLFERSNKQVLITEVGEHVVTYARRILGEVDAMKQIAQSAQDPLAGKFRLGAFPTLSSYLFPNLVPSIIKTMPNLKLILVEEKTDTLLTQLQKGELDAALLALPIHDDQLEVTTLFDDAFLLAVSTQHPLARKKTIAYTDFQKMPLMLLNEGHCLRDQALSVCQLNQLQEDQDFRATSLETLRQMVKAGTGITLIPEIAISKKEADIVYIPFVSNPPSRTIGLVSRKISARKAVLEKLETLIKNLMQPLKAH